MAIPILAAAGATAAKAGTVVMEAATMMAKAGVEAGAASAKAGSQVAATTAQTTTTASETASMAKDVMDLKTGKMLPDEALKGNVEGSDANLLSKIDSLKEQYCNDLQQMSPCRDTWNTDFVKQGQFQRISPEETMAKRLEFDRLKPDLIREWETRNHQPWPRYDADVYSEAGNVIRPKGGLYDAHHIQPLGMGGENAPENITPMNAIDHYDKQGIHALESAYDQLFKLLEE